MYCEKASRLSKTWVFRQVLLFVFGQRFCLCRSGRARIAACGINGLQVAWLSPTSQVSAALAPAFDDVDNHAGLGFAAFAVVGGSVRAKPNAVDGATCWNGKAVHFACISVRSCTVKYLRPIPDWLVATAMV